MVLDGQTHISSSHDEVHEVSPSDDLKRKVVHLSLISSSIKVAAIGHLLQIIAITTQFGVPDWSSLHFRRPCVAQVWSVKRRPIIDQTEKILRCILKRRQREANQNEAGSNSDGFAKFGLRRERKSYSRLFTVRCCVIFTDSSFLCISL